VWNSKLNDEISIHTGKRLTLEVTCRRNAGGMEGTQSAALGGQVD
jgi:hypothetical protein